MTTPQPRNPQFFAKSEELREWFDANAADADEAWIGFYKKSSGRPSITWAEAVDEALCVGWIDSVTKGLDDDSFAIRFTPRRKGSTWSLKNIRRVEELRAEGRLRPAGLAVFEQRLPDKSGTYSFEQESVELDEQALQTFRATPGAWEWFHTQPPSYRKAAIWWVISAKRPETRKRRLAALIDDSRARRRLAHLTPRRRTTSPR